MEQKKKKGLRIRSCLTGAIWLALVFSTVISALLFAFLNHFFNLPGSIPVLGWLLIFNTLIAGLITSFINAKLLEPITRLSKAMKEVSQGDFEQHLETNSRIAEVGESYQSFNVMTKELRATEVLQMDFVSNVSHEFKTPINAIEGYTMLLQGEELSPDQEEYVEKILFNTQRLSGLVGNILLLSKLENQNIPMKKTEYRLDEQIRQAFLSLETKWTEKEIGFQVELEEVKYTGNEGLFMHIWINLLDNAIKFSPSKGTITMFLKQEQDSVKFILEDEGPGIEDDVKSRIFDKFYQVDGSHKAEGNGLGLALVLGVSLCFLIYLLVSLIIPPLIGTHEKSDTQAEVSITTSERVCLIDNNEDALLWRLRLIRSAQEEIILSTFDFRADSSGTDVIAALWGAAERGVQVRLIIDGINAQLHLSGSDVFQALAAHDNVEVKFYNPIRLTQLWTVNYRCHDKYLIIDRSTYLMGGRNTSDLFLGSGGTSRQNIDRDIVVYNGGFTTASANTLLEYFDRIWLLDTNRAFHAEAENHRVKKATAILARRWTEINDTKQLTAINWETETLQTNEVALLSGDCTAWNKEPMLLNTLTTLMQKGEQNIVLQTPYMICNQAMYNALKKVTDNVQVQVITNAPQSGANPWGCADYLNHRDDILETGVDICEWNGSFSMHTKTILIDDRISIIGSFNWDMRSAYLDTEMMLLIDCPALNAILRDEAQQMMYEGKTISPDGVTVTGELYITPKVSATKQVLQSLLRIIVRPFRYVL